MILVVSWQDFALNEVLILSCENLLCHHFVAGCDLIENYVTFVSVEPFLAVYSSSRDICLASYSRLRKICQLRCICNCTVPQLMNVESDPASLLIMMCIAVLNISRRLRFTEIRKPEFGKHYHRHIR